MTELQKEGKTGGRRLLSLPNIYIVAPWWFYLELLILMTAV